MSAYYNEIDNHAAAWLRELIKRGLIVDGDVDERSIIDVKPSDIRGYDQWHWFAGIGGWSYALRLAGVPDSYPVWTASLPCQPFSVAGKQLGKSDERHLLPHFLELVRQCRPNRIFGEQVPGAIKHGWLDDLQTNMEKESYTIGAVVLGAHSVKAPHIRNRIYWTANSCRKGLEGCSNNSCAISIKKTFNISSNKTPGIWDAYAPNTSRICIDNGFSSGLAKCAIKGFGNAIVPQVAATFITAAMSI